MNDEKWKIAVRIPIEYEFVQPPKNAELLLSILVPREHDDVVIGCFREIYLKKVMRLGKRRANIWAWCDVTKTFVEVTRQWILRSLGIASVSDWLRRHLL